MASPQKTEFCRTQWAHHIARKAGPEAWAALRATRGPARSGPPKPPPVGYSLPKKRIYTVDNGKFGFYSLESCRRGGVMRGYRARQRNDKRDKDIRKRHAGGQSIRSISRDIALSRSRVH